MSIIIEADCDCKKKKRTEDLVQCLCRNNERNYVGIKTCEKVINRYGDYSQVLTTNVHIAIICCKCVVVFLRKFCGACSCDRSDQSVSLSKHRSIEVSSYSLLSFYYYDLQCVWSCKG